MFLKQLQQISYEQVLANRDSVKMQRTKSCRLCLYKNGIIIYCKYCPTGV
jgi:hypothetical protein